MNEDKAILESVVIRYKNAPSIEISAQEIEKMNRAKEALEMIYQAKNIAERLSKL